MSEERTNCLAASGSVYLDANGKTHFLAAWSGEHCCCGDPIIDPEIDEDTCGEMKEIRGKTITCEVCCAVIASIRNAKIRLKPNTEA